MSKPLLVVNPRSQGGRTGRMLSELLRPIEARLGGVDVAATERPRHAVELVETAALEGRETVVVMGGDGTLHEAVCGLVRARASAKKLPRLGYVGQGTGGDFRRTLGIEHRLERYLDVIAAGHTRRIDVGAFTYRDHEGAPREAAFLNILSMGMGGLVDRYVAEHGRTMGGTTAYFLASARALVESRVGRLKLTLTDELGATRIERLESRQLCICNGRYFGGGMHVAPMAVPDDGRFELVSLGAGSRLSFLVVSSGVYGAKHLGKPGVVHLSCRGVKVELENAEVDASYLLDVDGEPLGRLPIEVELLPGAIEVLAP